MRIIYNAVSSTQPNNAPGRLLFIEFSNKDEPVYTEIMRILQKNPGNTRTELDIPEAIALPGIKIHTALRKVYCGHTEIVLTKKEYDLLCLLAANKGIVLSYEQIYQKVWGWDSFGNEKNSVGCHVRNLRKKLYASIPHPIFTIRNIREVGYCYEEIP